MKFLVNSIKMFFQKILKHH